MVKNRRVDFCPQDPSNRQKSNRGGVLGPIDRVFAYKTVASNVRPGTSLPLEQGVEGRRRILRTLIRPVKSTEILGKTCRV